MRAYHVIFQVRLTADVALCTEKNRDVPMHAKKNEANRAFSLPVDSRQANFSEQKKVSTQEKGSTWPPFYCFKTPTWRTRRHVLQGICWAHALGRKTGRGNIDFVLGLH